MTNTKIKKSIIGIICIVGGIVFTYIAKENSDINSCTYIQLDNIEALASNEGSNSDCSGFGSIDCNGDKVKKMSTTFSLPIYK